MNKNLGVLWIIILGGFGFSCGFFGPMIFVPGANQGPLVGILITGPLGFLSGLLLWRISSVFKWSHSTQKKVAAAGCALFVIGIGVSLLRPKDEWPGRIYGIEVLACESSSANEVVLQTVIRRERIVKLEKPLFKSNFYFAGDLTSKEPQKLSFYIAGSCADFPAGFNGIYYVDHQAPKRDRAVLLSVPEYLKNL